MYYVTILWSRYYNLCDTGGSDIYTSREVAEDQAQDINDRIIEVANLLDSHALSAAFNDLCYWAWTPNQDADMRAVGAEKIEAAKAIIESFGG